ncbi:fasciculation and elongation protein zeta-2 isoform X3 [Cynoglossus semilaevis]|uniref:fasciculation and elongation protein zeta-2 isoform X3 n=1 Tax=Cynoglossus semilaevis TaxID=244447 RepID=UPI000D6236F2|nr:fasciculation and elongation protein zeta-2-like isoform X3 [Cynoglossus semilaevis]
MAAPVAHFVDVLPFVPDLKVQDLLPQRGTVAAREAATQLPPPPPSSPPPLPLVLLLRNDGGEPLNGSSFSSGESGALRSMEEVVNGFEEKLSMCFGNLDGRTESIAPVSVITEGTLLEGDEIWRALTTSYGQVMPVVLKQSRLHYLHPPTLDLEEKAKLSDVTVELSDDEELREQLDMHSIIVSSLGDEPLYTAEEVIEELEKMMQDSPGSGTEMTLSHTDLSTVPLDMQLSTSSLSYNDRVRSLGVAELNERLEATETNIRRFSEELVQQLARRDELDFEKEVKNSFISALIDVQNRQKEQQELLKKSRKHKGRPGTSQSHTERKAASVMICLFMIACVLHSHPQRFSMEGLSSIIQNGFRQRFSSGCSEKQYLTTVIPYEKGRPLSTEDLQVLTKILQAMRDDSDRVPGLLTDYILKAVV